MMNKKLLLLSIGLIITAQMIYSQVPSYVPTNGLVGYWPFNGNANDESGNGNNGTTNGASLTTDRFGNANSAYNFNGISDNITIPNSTSLSNMTSITISAWFNINQWDMINNQGWFPILSKTNSSSYGKYRLGAYTSVNGEPSLYGNLSTEATGITQNNLYSLNQWNQVVITISNGNSTIFLNGVQVYNGATSYTGWSTTDNLPLLIGKDIPGIVDYANGKIDDIGMWNRVLTQQEVTNMYNSVTYSDTCNAVSGSLVNGLVGYWPFCGNANDQSGNGNNGTVNGATLTTDRFGNNNSAYSFNGVNNSITIPDNTALRPTNISISCWILSPQLTTGNCIISKTQIGTATGEQYIIGYDMNGKANFQIKRNSSCVAGTNWQYLYTNDNAITNDIWQHLVCTYDGTTMKFYKNGMLIQSYVPTAGPIDNCSGGTLNIGRFWNNQYYFNGKIDDIGIWNRALTQQEISQLFNQNQCITNTTVTDTLIINVGQMSYTNPVTYANNITIYPNPASTLVTISFNNITDLAGGTIKVINSLGQQVATTLITLSGTNTTMALNSWGGAGLYFVQILNVQGIVVDVKKIILQ